MIAQSREYTRREQKQDKKIQQQQANRKVAKLPDIKYKNINSGIDKIDGQSVMT